MSSEDTNQVPCSEGVSSDRLLAAALGFTATLHPDLQAAAHEELIEAALEYGKAHFRAAGILMDR